MGRVDGKVAFITGGARGMGRSHAIRLAEEGADIIAVDICGQVDSVKFEMARPADLQETVRAVESLGRRIVAEVADVRDQEALDRAVKVGLAEFGRIDIVSANAGITGTGQAWEFEESVWQDMIDVNLTGVWHTVKATVPSMIAAGNGGSIVLTSSHAGLVGSPNVGHYVAAKHGVIGLMRTLANELGPHKIRVNSIMPGITSTPMFHNQVMYSLFAPDIENPTREDVASRARELGSLGVDFLDARDQSNALLWLSSDEARYVTGVAIPVDGGWMNK